MSMTELQHLDVKLSGINLIEAGAGTGKTYAIVCLYLRLLLEKQLLPEQILVVTFTEAATKELKGRIYDKLREAAEVFASGQSKADDFLQQLYQRYPDKQKALRRFEHALASFDTASVFTIHGFCMRALQDHAFLTGSRFETKLITDPTDFYTEIVQDFWRINFFDDNDGLTAAVLGRKISPQTLVGFIRQLLLNPGCQVEPHYTEADITAITVDCSKLYGQLQKIWQKRREELTELLETHKGLSRSAKNYHPDNLPLLFEAMDDYCNNNQQWALFSDFNKFCSSYMEGQRLKKTDPPKDTFFNLADQIMQLADQRILAVKSELYQYCRHELSSRKEKQNICFFDDLLSRLYNGLQQPAAKELAMVLREQFRAALIDEFQDTDPLQYGIFRQIYSSGNQPLFLIGDPKQAIYSFRGADIFAYLQAVQDTDSNHRFTLTVNRRSTPQLLQGFNTIFQNRTNPFIHKDIGYEKAKPAPDWKTDQLVINGDAAPIQLWYLPQTDKPYSVDEANRWAAKNTAAEIARLLQQARNKQAMLNDQPLQPGDIAVIVRTHRQGQMVRKALQKLNIPSVMRSDASVFDAPEAAELALLMQSILSPHNEPLLRAALVSDLLGKTATEIAELLEDEAAWEKLLRHFNDYHQLWQDKGFMVMFRFLLVREQVRARLLAFNDGERRLTNLLHIAELVHSAVHQQNLGMEAATAWLVEKVATADKKDEYQQRLETDDALVRIVTIHMSKGLEYPIVFNPFLWDGSSDAGQETINFHEQFKLIKDFGSSDYAKRQPQAEEELLAENLRLFYVAVTRARCRCYLLAVQAGKNKERQARSPLNLLLVADNATDDFTEQIRQLAAKSDGSINASLCNPEVVEQITPLQPEDRAITQPHPRQITRQQHDYWRVTSFTALAAADYRQPEQPDRDEHQQQPPQDIEVQPEQLDIFGFPRGAKAGLFFHELLEELDFTASDQEKIKLHIGKLLDKYNYGQQWLPVVQRMLGDLFKVRFAAPDGAGFTLGELAANSLLPEMEFFFPLRLIQSEQLAALLHSKGDFKAPLDGNSLVQRLGFRPVQGMVRGFIDLIFRHNDRYYLLDWKSNHLGYKAEDYNPAAIAAEMERNLYPLQYLLYTVALHHYLGLRVKNYAYDQHFGGVIYLFLRGIAPESSPSCGLYQDRPSRELVEELSKLMVE